MNETPTGFRELFDRLLDADVQTRERILEDVHRDSPSAAKRLRAMIDSAPDPVSTIGLWQKIPTNLGDIPVLETGARVDDFRVLAAIGAGAIATVYLAVDERLGRRVALKVSRSTGKEPRLLAKLTHPGIVQAHRVFRDVERNADVLVLQYVEGVTLEDALLAGCFQKTTAGRCLGERLESRLGSPISDGPSGEEAARRLGAMDTPTLALRIALELCDALAFAHSRGVLHLDLKPSNVFLDRGGHPILGDFNVSVDETDMQPIGGTLAYMAPEQLGTTGVDGRSDLFSLGKLLARLFLEAPPECLPLGLESWIRTVTATDPAARPPDVNTAAESLREISRWHKVREAQQNDPRWIRLVRRHPFVATFIVAILPNAAMSALQILYNRVHIVGLATAAQQSIFRAIVAPWNVVVFALGGYLLCGRFAPPDNESPEAAIRRLRHNVIYGSAISSVGWIIGCALFVLSMGVGAPPLATALVEHFVVSFVLAAALCASYAGQGIAFVDAVGWIPKAYAPQNPAVVATTRIEAKRLLHYLQVLSVACGFLPLLGAAVIVWEGPSLHGVATAYPFQLLVLLALVFSCLGFAFASRIAREASRALRAFTPTEES